MTPLEGCESVSGYLYGEVMSGSIGKGWADGSFSHYVCQRFKFCHDGLEWNSTEAWVH